MKRFICIAAVFLAGCTTAEVYDKPGDLQGTTEVVCTYTLPISQCQERMVKECPNGYRVIKYGAYVAHGWRGVAGKRMNAMCTSDGKFINEEPK